MTARGDNLWADVGEIHRREHAPAPPRHILGRVVEWVVSTSVMPPGTANLWRLTTSLALLLIPTLSLFAAFYALHGVYLATAIFAGTGLSLVALIAFGRQTGRHDISTGLGLMLLVAMLGFISLFRGHFSLSAMMWLALIPVASHFLLGIGWLKLTAAASLAIGSVIYLLPRTALVAEPLRDPANRLQLDYISWFTFVIVAGAIPYLFSKFHAKHRVEEHERLQVAERSRRLQSVGALAAGVAHEFNNLLTVVAGNASMLASSGSRSDEEAEDLRAIVEAAEIGAKLTRDLLALSRADDGEARCQLPEALTSALRLMAPTLGPGIAVVLDIEEPLPVVAIGRQQVEQIFINLALNGKKAMNGAGTLAIEVTAVDEAAAIIEGLEPGVWVRAAISDDGCGMSAEVQERMFDPFYTSAEVGGGTGLGLSIIFGMVSQIGGTIRVASEVGAGTCFEIFLPAGDLPSPASEPEPEPEPEPALAPAQPRLLLVEDDHQVRRLARRVLDGAGYQVLEAEDGRDALDLLESDDTFDLIVTDVRMPRLSGTQLATEARAAGVRAPFLFMSGHLDESMATHIRAELDSRLVSKPFTPAARVDAVREVLAQR